MSESNSTQNLDTSSHVEQTSEEAPPHIAPGQLVNVPEDQTSNKPAVANSELKPDLIADDDFDPQDFFDQQGCGEMDPEDPNYFLPEKANCECCQGYINICQKIMDPMAVCNSLGYCECCEDYDEPEENVAGAENNHQEVA